MAHRFASGSGLASQARASVLPDVISVSASTTLTPVGMVFATAATADITLLLPLAASCMKKSLTVKKVAGAYNVKIAPQGADKIDSTTLVTLSELMAAYTLFSDGAAWYLM